MGEWRERNGLRRLPTGAPGLDPVLRGGLLSGGIYILMGQPGTGKTTLATQICFAHVRQGGRAVYLTLLAESHARLVLHLEAFDFFDPDVVGDALHYLSGYRMLETSGLDGLLDLIRGVVRQRKATLFVMDGLAPVEGFAPSLQAFRRFVHELHATLELFGCTGVLLSEAATEARAEHTMVDGIIELRYRLVDQRAVRELVVRKLRGSPFLDGIHTFTIDGEGVRVYPRTEARLTPSPDAAPPRARLAVGVAGLDTMLHGGLLAGSASVLLGAPGSGKTLLGLHYLAAGAAAGERCLDIGFYETPDRLIAKAEDVGLPIRPLVEAGCLDLQWSAPLEYNLDALAERILDAVERRNVTRLFVDGLNALTQGAVYPERLGRFVTALTNELRARGVTTVFAVDTRGLFTNELDVPIAGVTEIVDNIIHLRYVAVRSQLYRLVSILKVRESAYETAIREFTIGPEGIRVAPDSASAERILAGEAPQARSRQRAATRA